MILYFISLEIAGIIEKSAKFKVAVKHSERPKGANQKHNAAAKLPKSTVFNSRLSYMSLTFGVIIQYDLSS